MSTNVKFAGLLLIPLFFYMYYVIRRIADVIGKNRKTRLQKYLSAAAAALLTVSAYDFYSCQTAVILYFAGISVIVDAVFLIMKKAGCRFKSRTELLRRSGGMAALITLVVIGYAYTNMHTVTAVEYDLSTEKAIRPEGYCIIFLSDLHFGTTMRQEALAGYCRRMENENPDLVILCGDIVDEFTSLVQVREAFETLGNISCTYGVFYVYGNHDKGNYSDRCDFTEEELAQTVKDCGIRILEDKTVMINEELSLSGRQDRTDVKMRREQRASSRKLLKDIPDSAFHILADHQPREMEKNDQAGFDLMLSGHTHGGQMWPAGVFTALFDKDTVNYGQKSYENMQLLVSSGIAGWRYPLRTGKHCEYVTVRIRSAGD